MHFSLQTLIQDYLPIFDDDLGRLFDGAQLPDVLDRACRYSMSAGGKRLRPLLVMSAFMAFNGKNLEMARRAAMCVELLHGYSLIHDDLPCMDDDELRRGKPTCHIVFGEDVALLAGDVLQSLAFESLSADIDGFGQIDLALVGELTHIFAPRARRMVAGQMRDVLGESQALTQVELETIHKDKTGALIEASLLMGGVCAAASNDELEVLAVYAKSLGLAFQVQDDVLDVVSDSQTLGKPVGSDEKLDKSTYVKLLGVEGAKVYADELFAHAMTQADVLHKDSNALILKDIVAWVQGRSH